MKSPKLNFSNLTGHGIKVAVVDSGIDGSHPKVGSVSGGISFRIGPGAGVACSTDFSDPAGHGTACAGLIRKIAPNVELYAIRVFDETLTAGDRALVAAIRWAVVQKMDIVNLSLGTTDVTSREAIASACKEAIKAGLILIASEHNSGLESYPSALPEVIGVTAGSVSGQYGYIYRTNHAIEIIARGDEQRLCWTDGREIVQGGTSFAAPRITGLVALIREAFPGASLQMVREVLATNALNAGSTSSRPHPAPYHKISYDWITKAALYPYNKEMHALVRFRDLLKFKITGIADPPGKGMVGRDAGEAIGTTSSGIRIRPCLQDALRDADTLILGYVDQLGRLSKRDLLREAIQTALEANVNIFSFHAVPYERYADLYETARRKELHIAYPHLPAEEIGRTLNTRPTSPVDIPVLGVFGTSSQQGKFTLQLLLRRKLMQVGYRVGGIGTEHHAELFGLDLAFPIGYASPLTLPLQYYAPYLDQKLRDICKQTRPDILLVGAQSGTVPYHVHEHATHALPSLAFALGTKPDACILVVNSIDSHSYIRDTIDGLRAIAKVPTLLLAMGDQEKHIRTAYGRTLISPRKMSPEEIGQHLQRLEDTFAIPAVEILSDEGQNKMIETIIEHFRADPLEQTLEVICKTELPLSRQ